MPQTATATDDATELPQLYRVTVYITRDAFDVRKPRKSEQSTYLVVADSDTHAISKATVKTLQAWKGFNPHPRSDAPPYVSLCPDGIAVL